VSGRGGKSPGAQKKDHEDKSKTDSFHKPPALENENVTPASKYLVRMNNATKMLTLRQLIFDWS
jgi:hypothetical protein